MRNKTNLERVDRYLMFVLPKQVGLAIVEPNNKLTAVKNLQSTPAIKTINSCINNPLNKQACFIYYFNIRTRHTRTHPISPLNSRNPCWTVFAKDGKIENIPSSIYRIREPKCVFAPKKGIKKKVKYSCKNYILEQILTKMVKQKSAYRND